MPSRCRARSRRGSRSSRRTAASASTACCKRAIDYAENGFPVAARVAWDWARHVGKLKADPGCAQVTICSTANAPKEGDVIRFPALAATLEDHRRKGARAFYEGEIADDMAKTLAGARLVRHGGGFRRTPRRGRHADLDQLSRRRSPRDPAERAGAHRAGHAQHPGEFRHGKPRPDRRRPLPSGAGGRASRLMRVRDTHIADAAHMRMTVADLLDKGFAKKLAALIDMNKRAKLPPRPTPGSDTVYLTVVDRDRMAVSFINSLYSQFRSRHLHREDRHHADQPRRLLHARAGPSERHSVRPSGRCTPSFRRLAMRDGRCDMSFGVMGAHYQPMGHVQIIINMLDYGMDVQQAIDARASSSKASRAWSSTARRRRPSQGSRRAATTSCMRRRPGAARRRSRSIGIAAC